MLEKTHFTVGEGLDNLARQGYWYEDRKKWAKKLLKNLCVDISEKQMMDVLRGDAKVMPINNGTMVELIYEEDKGFKSELKEHLDFLAKEKKNNIRAKKHLGFCGKNNSICRYWLSDNRCAFSRRELWGCFLNNPEKIESQIGFALSVRKQEFLNSWTGKNRPDKIVQEMSGIKCKPLELHAYEISDMIDRKVFDFIFKGHHYTINDSARNQSECPHCSQHSKGNMWDKLEDKSSFLGIKKISDNQFIYCFECPECFNKFFYHNSRGDIN